MMRHIFHSNKNKNIHLRFLLAGTFFAVYGWWFADGVLDINLHHTYFVIEHVMLYLFFGAYLIFCGVMYFTLGQSAKRDIKGGQIHYLFTVLSVLALILFNKLPILFDHQVWGFTLSLFLALGSQVLLPINIIRSVLRPLKTETSS